MGRISKMGNPELRCLLVLGATAVLRGARKNERAQPWLRTLLARRPFKVAAVALAFLWARRFGVRAWPAAFAAVAVGVSPFFLGLEGRIFPDLATAALLVACLLLMELPAPRPWQALVLGLRERRLRIGPLQ